MSEADLPAGLNFQQAMKHLFSHMQIELPLEDENEVYAVTVDQQVTMRFFSAPEGYLNIVAQVGRLPKRIDPARLLGILQLNCFTPLYPGFNFKVGVEKSTGVIEVWLRQALSELERNQVAGRFNFVLETSLMVMRQLALPASATAGGAAVQTPAAHAVKSSPGR